MNFDEQDNIQNQLQSWHWKKNIKCPSCKSSLFHFDRMPFFSSVRIINDIVLIHHSQCQSSIGMCRKALYFCFSCGSQSLNTSGRLQDKGCKAKKCPSLKNHQRILWRVVKMVLDTNSTIHTSQQWVLNRTKRGQWHNEQSHSQIWRWGAGEMNLMPKLAQKLWHK